MTKQTVAKYVTRAGLVVVGIIHLLPLSGVLSSARIAGLYGVDVDDANLVILLRHRAVLFGVLGGFLIYAAFHASLQRLALIAGAVSVGSFLWLASTTGSYNEQLSRVFSVDIAAIVILVTAAVAHVYARAGK